MERTTTATIVEVGNNRTMRRRRSTKNSRRSLSYVCVCLYTIVLVLLVGLEGVESVIETSQIDVRVVKGESSSSIDSITYRYFVSQALFGPIPSMLASHNEEHIVRIPPEENPLLCQNVTVDDDKDDDASLLLWKDSIVMAPRGVCTFAQKAYTAQQLGAKALLIYGTLGSRYALNVTKYINATSSSDYNMNFTVDDIVYPQPYLDYDCSFGRAWIPSSAIELEPLPYNSKHNDPILSGSTDSNLCKVHSEDQLNHCASQACFLTGKTDTTDTTDTSNSLDPQDTTAHVMEACCAWDLSIYLYGDLTTFSYDAIQIPVAYLTMEQANRIFQDIHNNNDKQQLYITLSSRYRPKYNTSFVFIWSLGVFVAALSAYMSAKDYRQYIQYHLPNMQQQQHQQHQYMPTLTEEQDKQHPHLNTNTTITTPAHQEQPTGHANDDQGLHIRIHTPQQQSPPPPYHRSASNEDHLELNAYHAVCFVAMASTGLLILYFFKIYNVVKLLYAVGCSKAVSQIVLYPIFRVCALRFFGYHDQIVWRTNSQDLGDITMLDIVSHIMGYALGILWIVICFTVRHPEDNTYFWVMQDIMGASMCITFLEAIKLNSIRVASILLIVAFFYDIFFVFITPMIFKGESVMVTVATSGGPPKADASWCEKYPDDANCQGGDPLPMLLTIPRIGDYLGGSSLLGLGDIVLPGLLLSFAARYDAAKSLLGVLGGGNGALRSYGTCPESSQKICGRRCCYTFCNGGYFVPTVIAYAVGLFMANSAVYIMNMGQPALLYLVPCTLGTVMVLGWRRNEIRYLWDGPKALQTADKLVYGTTNNGTARVNNEDCRTTTSTLATSTTTTTTATTPSAGVIGEENTTICTSISATSMEDPETSEQGDVPLLSGP